MSFTQFFAEKNPCSLSFSKFFICFGTFFMKTDVPFSLAVEPG